MERSVHHILNYALIGYNQPSDDFMEMDEINENPVLFFTIKTLRNFIDSMDYVLGTNNMDIYRSTFNLIDSTYKSIGGETRDLVCLLLNRLFNKSKKKIHHDILDFLCNQVSNDDIFYINKKEYAVNIFSILLKNYEFEKACQILDRYDISKSHENQNPLLHNDSPEAGIYKPEFRSLTQQYCSNSISPMTYLNKQLLLLSSIYSLYESSYENRNTESKEAYWKKLIKITGSASEAEQEFILSWMIHMKKDKEVFNNLIEKGFIFNANKGKALYTLYNSLEKDDFKLLNFLEENKQNIIDNSQRDQIELVNLWFESNYKRFLGSFTRNSAFINQIKSIKESLDLMYDSIFNKPMPDILFGRLKDRFLEIYKDNYYKDKKTNEMEKNILLNYFEIEKYFDEINGTFKEDITIKKRL